MDPADYDAYAFLSPELLVEAEQYDEAFDELKTQSDDSGLVNQWVDLLAAPGIDDASFRDYVNGLMLGPTSIPVKTALMSQTLLKLAINNPFYPPGRGSPPIMLDEATVLQRSMFLVNNGAKPFSLDAMDVDPTMRQFIPLVQQDTNAAQPVALRQQIVRSPLTAAVDNDFYMLVNYYANLAAAPADVENKTNALTSSVYKLMYKHPALALNLAAMVGPALQAQLRHEYETNR